MARMMDNSWTQLMPPMKTKRYTISAVLIATMTASTDSAITSITIFE